VVDELLSRGHSVVGISRSPPPKWAADGDYRPHAVDFHDTNRFEQALSQDFNAIVFWRSSKRSEYCVEGHSKIKEAVLQSEHSGDLITIGMSALPT
jgi:putative NADH-flavin reductase